MQLLFMFLTDSTFVSIGKYTVDSYFTEGKKETINCSNFIMVANKTCGNL